MIIRNIHIDGFGKLHNKDIELSEKINVLTGENEAGKSTLHLFLYSMFYGVSTLRKSGTASDYERMRPWDAPKDYGGSIDVLKDGVLYRISRDFNKSPDDLSITNLFDRQETIFSKEAFMDELLSGLSKTAYANTVSSGQLQARTERGMADELKKYAENISATANPNLSVDKALAALQGKKDEEEQKIDPDAARRLNLLHVKENELLKAIRDPAKVNLIREYSDTYEKNYEKSGEVSGLISDLEIKIDEKEKYLEGCGIKKESDPEKLKEKAGAFFKKQNTDGIAAIILFIVGICLIALCIFLLPPEFTVQPLGELILPIIAGAAGFICVIAGIVFLIKRRNTRSALSKLMDTHLKAQQDMTQQDKAQQDSAKQDKAHQDMTQQNSALLDSAGSQISEAGKEVSDGKNSGEINPAEKISTKKETKPDESKKSIKERLDSFYEVIQSYKNEFSILNTLKSEQNKYKESLEKLDAIKNDYLGKLNDQRKMLSDVEGDIVSLSKVRRDLNELEMQIENNKLARENIEAISMARETLEDLSTEIKNSVGTYINKEAGRMLSGLTAGTYMSLDAGADYNGLINSPQGFIPFNYLSRGTIDQVYLSVRLASIRFMTSSGDPIPLLLDDSFALFDDRRLEASLKFLSSNYRGQILMFTCQNREENILTSLSIPHKKIKL